MQKWFGIGRLTKDPDVRYSQGEKAMAIARYTLAVDRKFKKDGEQTADFINCVSFGKGGEFAEKYFKKGTKVAIVGRIQTGSYTNKEGQKVYTTDIVVEEQEFAESKSSQDTYKKDNGITDEKEEFVNIPDGLDDQIPFL